jgi:hypothetical protein
MSSLGCGRRDGRIALRAFALPYDEAASVLRDEAWATWLVGERTSARAAGVPEDPRPTDACLFVWLVAHVDAVRMDEAAAEMVDEIADVHRRLTRAVDRSPDRIYIGPCGSDVETVVVDERDGVISTRLEHSTCDRDVYREITGGTARCDGYRQDGRGCGARHDLAVRQSWFRASIEDMLAPIVEWQAALPEMFPNRYLWPSRFTWARWAENPPHLLEQHAEDTLGRGMFRGGDVLAQVESEQGRMRRKRDADERTHALLCTSLGHVCTRCGTAWERMP